MADKYIAHYQVSDANNQVIYQGEIEANHKGNEAAQSTESKEALENQILLSLDVAVIKLEKKNE